MLRSSGLQYAKCPLASACLPGTNGTRAQCRPGFQSIACSACASGYFLQFGSCQRCPKAQGTSVAAVVGAVLVLVLVVGVLFRVRTFLPVEVIKVNTVCV